MKIVVKEVPRTNSFVVVPDETGQYDLVLNIVPDVEEEVIDWTALMKVTPF